jgi:biotin synthase-like enzyme
MNVCCGGIVGMGETAGDRAGLLQTLATLPEHPESVPINLLVRVEGTPLAGTAAELDPFDFVRTVAVARILMPRSRVRLSAGRTEMSDELQALCFLAGANSIFYGEKLLTTGNPDVDQDRRLFERLQIRAEPSARSADPPANFAANPRPASLTPHRQCAPRPGSIGIKRTSTGSAIKASYADSPPARASISPPTTISDFRPPSAWPMR